MFSTWFNLLLCSCSYVCLCAISCKFSSFISYFVSLISVLFLMSLAAAAAAAKSLQSCLILCNPRDGSPPGSPIPRILQATALERVAISFSSAWKWKVKVKSLSRVRLFATPWTAAYQAPPSMGFSRQEYWSGVPLPNICGWSTQNATSAQTFKWCLKVPSGAFRRIHFLCHQLRFILH